MRIGEGRKKEEQNAKETERQKMKGGEKGRRKAR